MATPKKKKPTLTAKEAQIVKAKVEAVKNGKTQREIAKELYPNASQAAAEVEVSKNLNKPNVQEAMQIALAKYDLTPDRIAGVVSDGMSAQKVVIVGNGEEAFADVQPDHSIRLKAAGMAAKFMGADKSEGGGDTYNFTQVNNNLKGKYDD